MSRRKMKGLTQTGRQVSEDPDLDKLLSTLSPEEVEALQIDLSKVPDINPEDGAGAVAARGESQTRDSRGGHQKENDSNRRLSQREQSLEPTDPKDSRKQEYPKRTSLNKEGNCDTSSSLQRKRESGAKKLDDQNSKDPESFKGNRSRSKQEESSRSEVNQRDNRLQRDRESVGSKAKDMISKLQEKKEDKEKEKREDFRRRDDSKTKDIISKLKEKSEKDLSKERRSESFRTQGLVSKMLEKQSKAQDNQESKIEIHKSKTAEERNRSDVKVEEKVPVKQAGKGGEELVNHSDQVEEKGKKAVDKKAVDKKADDQKADDQKADDPKADDPKADDPKADEKITDSKGKDKTSTTDVKITNCVTNNSQKTKTKEEDEDEDSSMFDELMEQVRTNDHTLTELNVNNSEVIKTKTLIEFAEALKNNTHIKSFALANCRADDHVAYAIAGMLRHNKTITSLNVDSNLLTGKGILSLIQALQYNCTLTELRFQNQRHICGGKTEMELVKILKDNTTLLKLGYHFELAGPRMTATNILSRNMDRQRQKRLQEQKQAQANGEKKGTLDVPKAGSLRNSPKTSPKPSPIPSPMPSPKMTSKRRTVGGLMTPPPPPPPPAGVPPPPPPPMLDIDLLKNSLTPVSQRKLDGKGTGGSKNSRDQLLASIRTSNIHHLKKVPVPKWLQ